jgi:hypothetical protein
MDKKMWITVIVAAVLIVAAFFGGAASARLIPGMSGNGNGFAGRQFGGQNGAPGMRGGVAGGGAAGGGAVSGKVLKTSPGSITVQARDGSSRIVNLSSTTKFSKTVEAAAADVSVGTTVTAFGQAGSGNTVDALQVMIGSAGFGFGGMRPPGTQGGGTTNGSGGQGGQGGGMPFGPPGQ